jgi:hypothetical protein
MHEKETLVCHAEAELADSIKKTNFTILSPGTTAVEQHLTAVENNLAALMAGSFEQLTYRYTRRHGGIWRTMHCRLCINCYGTI